MTLNPRFVLSALGVAFTAYLGLGWPWWDNGFDAPWTVTLFAVALYLVTSWICIFWEDRTRPAPAEAEDPAIAGSGGRVDEDTSTVAVQSLMTSGVSGPTVAPAWVAALALVTAAVHLRFDAYARFTTHIQRTDTFRAIDFVTGE